MEHHSLLPNTNDRPARGRIAMRLAVAAGAALGAAVVALSASTPSAPNAGDVYLDTAPVHERTTSPRAAQADGRLDAGVNWAAIEPSLDPAPLAVASYERWPPPGLRTGVRAGRGRQRSAACAAGRGHRGDLRTRAMAEYEQQRFATAFDALTGLADAGHRDAARIALLMVAHGPRL